MRRLVSIVAAVSACAVGARRRATRWLARRRQRPCQVCHGLDGIAKLPDAPNLAGQKEIYLVRSLTAYKTGERQNPQMSIVAPTLSDDDIANLSAYYASIKIDVQKP